MTLLSAELNDQQFHKITQMVHRTSGIHLKQGKEALVKARLMKRLRALGLGSVDQYLSFLQSNEGSGEMTSFIDVMTTNKTSFFREAEHFNYLRDTILPEVEGAKLRFWSAACSSGEEPYSLAILLREHLADIDKKDLLILATDISRSMLEKADKAIYHKETVVNLPCDYINKYFIKNKKGHTETYQVTANIKKLVRLRSLNLMGPWPMKGSFNVIFCRNVMIYFDRTTQQRLINRFWEFLKPGGHLFVGHSEGLAAINHNFRYVRPATYRK